MGKPYHYTRRPRMASSSLTDTAVARRNQTVICDGGSNSIDRRLEDLCIRLAGLDNLYLSITTLLKKSRTRSSRQLTFGLEWEFMIPQGTTGIESHPQDSRFYVKYADMLKFQREWALLEHIRSLLHDAVPVYVDHEHLEQVAAEKGLKLAAGRPKCAYFWNLDTDYSLRPCAVDDVQGDYEFPRQYSLELRSRVLTEQDFDEVTAVYKLLRRHLRINLNRTCSFHCHVGTGHLDLTGYKKLVTLVVVSEPFLYRCCARHRQKSRHCRSIASSSRFAHQTTPRLTQGDTELRNLMSPDTPCRVVDLLIYVWRAACLSQLREGLIFR